MAAWQVAVAVWLMLLWPAVLRAALLLLLLALRHWVTPSCLDMAARTTCWRSTPPAPRM
jgi:hypothetical protein